MTRINQVFQTQDKKLISFITSGDSNYEVSNKALQDLAVNCDIIELGMPFSDPVADGSTIQAANERALANGANLQSVLQQVRDFRKTNDKTAIVLMGYFNPIFKYGVENFINDAKNAGVDGLIVVDLPFEHDNDLQVLAKEAQLDYIRLITPTTTENRMKQMLANASGFVYFVSVNGTTGNKSAIVSDLESKISTIKKYTNLPIAIGFGIKTSEQAKAVAKFAEAVVVGSAIVEKVFKNEDIVHFTKEIKEGINK